ncbi:MAG: Gfo/Idh/MocA family oxidoreductase [Verrucomicrobiota bacterium]|jgi:predicted dehydrogenase
MKTTHATPSPLTAGTPQRANSASRAAGLSRRKFMLAGGAAAAFTIVPRHVLGGPGFVPPSEKITLAYIGCGTQGLREMVGMLPVPEIQIVAVCDPVRDSHQYLDWSGDGLRASIAEAMGKPDWRRGMPGIPGGRDVAKELIETFYARRRSSEKISGCRAYADFRELLEQEKDINAVKIMTPDHLHAAISIAAMRKGKHVLMHKPLANRLQEARWVIEAARKTKVATHFLAANDGADVQTIKNWIDDGAIGTLREIHNWTNRPVWPQYASIPTDTPRPADFDWSLWLGPCADRPYHPHYTHMVFRGWYDFGGGALADMGYYSLWSVFKLFDLDSPISVESHPSHVCSLDRNVAIKIKNDYSFPDACVIRFKFAAKGPRPPIDLYWYDGSMKPPTPDELEIDGQELAAEGLMFVGDKGKILADFRGEDPQIVPARKMRDYLTARNFSAPPPSPRDFAKAGRLAIDRWVAACKGGPATYGDFLQGGPISDAFNLAAISLRLGGRKLVFDALAMRITNLPEASHHFTREYRKGWDLQGS